MLQAHKYVTKFKIRVLEALKEELTTVQSDRAFTFILRMREQQSAKEQQEKEPGNSSTLLGNLIAHHFNQHYLLPADYSFSSKLREGCSGQNRVAASGGLYPHMTTPTQTELQWSKSCSGEWRTGRRG